MFKRIQKDNPKFNEIKAQLADISDRFDYNALVREYNQLELEDLVTFPYTQGKLASLVKQLEKRGLKRDVDFAAQGAIETDGEGKDAKVIGYNAFVTRLSGNAGAILQPAQRGPRKRKEEKAASAGEAPASSGDATPAKTGAGKPRK